MEPSLKSIENSSTLYITETVCLSYNLSLSMTVNVLQPFLHKIWIPLTCGKRHSSSSIFRIHLGGCWQQNLYNVCMHVYMNSGSQDDHATISTLLLQGIYISPLHSSSLKVAGEKKQVYLNLLKAHYNLIQRNQERTDNTELQYMWVWAYDGNNRSKLFTISQMIITCSSSHMLLLFQ